MQVLILLHQFPVDNITLTLIMQQLLFLAVHYMDFMINIILHLLHSIVIYQGMLVLSITAQCHSALLNMMLCLKRSSRRKAGLMTLTQDIL
ncbi:unnamed protein product [Prunus brigantina]